MKLVDKLLGRTPVREPYPPVKAVPGGRKPLEGNRKHLQEKADQK